EVDPKYGIAWNNVGVVLAHQGETENAIEAFRTALQQQATFAAARLNLALLLFHLRRFQLSLEAYRQVLAEKPESAPAWNGVGLVLVELKRFQDARNAFVRAVEADPNHAGAHYNLSFTLSNLGDFDGALRATKRALELDPYYVSQKFVLTIDLQFEEGMIGVVPEISADVTTDTIGTEFAFDQRLLDNIFQELAPPPSPAAVAAEKKPKDEALALARDYVSKGLLDLALAEAVRAVQRGGAAPTPPRWSSTRATCRCGSSWDGCTSRKRNGRTPSAPTSRRSTSFPRSTRPRWRWRTCCAARGAPGPRSSSSRTSSSRIPTTSTPCC